MGRALDRLALAEHDDMSGDLLLWGSVTLRQIIQAVQAVQAVREQVSLPAPDPHDDYLDHALSLCVFSAEARTVWKRAAPGSQEKMGDRTNTTFPCSAQVTACPIDLRPTRRGTKI